jgi:iron complex outermembrane recepter protein
MSKPLHNPVVAFIAAAALGALHLRAQTTSARTTTSSSPAGDEPVELSAFTVTESSDTSYIASESVTGTRVATLIKDLPFAVSVVTSEFMNDFDFFDIASDLTYVANLNNVDTQGNSNLRGYGATFYMRNGFYRLGLVDRVNIDRIEVIKGPNAAIYGSTSPAGLINIVTKRPRFGVDSQRFTFTAGSLDMRRGEMNVNTDLGTHRGVQLASLFSANVQNVGSETEFASNKNRLVSEAILAKFPDSSTLQFEIEWSKRKAVPATSQLPFEYNPTTKKYSGVKRPDLAHFSQGGPNSVANRELTTVYLTYDKRWNRTWSTHAGANYYARHARNFNNGSRDQFDPVKRQFQRGNVVVDPLNEDGGAVQIDTLADYRLFNGALQNKTLLTLDYAQNWRYREQRGVNSKLYSIEGVFIDDPDYDLPPFDAFNIITRRDKVRWDIRGFFLRQQTTALDGRLVGFVGLRRDLVTYNFNFGDQFNTGGSKPGSLKSEGEVSHYTDSAWSPAFGLNYKVTPTLALYASHSQSFSPNGQVAKLGDPHLDNETSVGWDYGVKASLLNNRLVFTLGGFYIDRYGVKTTRTDPVTGLKETVAAGTQASKGVEFEGSWRVNDRLTVLGSYGYVNARIVYNGNAVTDVGQRPDGLPIDQGSLAWKYQFGGALRGLSWNTGITYSGLAYPNSTADLDDPRRYITAPSYTLVNMGLSYSWAQRDHSLRHSVRLSAKNLFDRDYETSRGDLGTGRGVFLAYTLSH